jgi:transposase-like protein
MQLTKTVLETALAEEMTSISATRNTTRAGSGADNIGNGTRAKW